MKEILILLFGCVIMVLTFIGITTIFYFQLGVHKKFETSKPITPELKITGDGVNMDTVYIYKLEEL